MAWGIANGQLVRPNGGSSEKGSLRQERPLASFKK